MYLFKITPTTIIYRPSEPWSLTDRSTHEVLVTAVRGSVDGPDAGLKTLQGNVVPCHRTTVGLNPVFTVGADQRNAIRPKQRSGSHRNPQHDVVFARRRDPVPQLV